MLVKKDGCDRRMTDAAAQNARTLSASEDARERAYGAGITEELHLI
jgi:hypothetical protein